MSQTVPRQLVDFISQEQKNAWLEDGLLKIYVRSGIYPLGPKGRATRCLWLANCQTNDYALAGTGFLKPVFQLMDAFLEVGLVDILCVENVMSPRMKEILDKNGWDPDGEMLFADDGTPIKWCSYWKMVVDPRCPT